MHLLINPQIYEKKKIENAKQSPSPAMTYSRERLPADNSENESWIMQNTSIESHQSGGTCGVTWPTNFHFEKKKQIIGGKTKREK